MARAKFTDPDFTQDGAPRASVPFIGLDTLWVNTGTLCNIACAHCYIESSPANDRLEYLTREEFRPFLDEALAMGAREIAFTGGEPFMNPDMIAMAGDSLDAGFSVLILTNAMRPAMRPSVRDGLRRLGGRHGGRLKIRVSLDHYTPARHDEERGAGAFAITLDGLKALAADGLALAVAGRNLWGEAEAAARAGYRELFAANAFSIDELVIFPEMDGSAETPEITTDCWKILDKSPASVMCARSRMVVKRKGAPAPVVLSCTLIPYDRRFEMGATLEEARGAVKLNHPHCSKFCVLGGASCSG